LAVATDDEEEDDESSDDSPKATPAAMAVAPVTILVRTALGVTLLDQRVELQNVQSHRTVASLKESVRRQLPGKPPVVLLQLLHEGVVLANDEVVADLVEEDDEHEDDDDAPALTLTLDMVPPVDPAFMSQLDESVLDELNTADLLQAYCANEAALLYNGAALQQEAEPVPVDTKDTNDDKEDDEEDCSAPRQQPHTTLVSVTLRAQAARLRDDLQTSVLSSATSQTLLAETRPPRELRVAAATQMRGHRTVRTGGRSTFLKQQIQRQFNVAWGDSLRYCVLFVLFGHFGGRTPVARAILLLGAPAVFVLQARVVKVALKRFLYTLLDHPPGIFLSLLPAPQQVLLNLHTAQAMELLYGSHALENSANASAGRASDDPENDEAWSEDDDDDDDQEADLEDDQEAEWEDEEEE
jgi:hypothetical protein